MKVRKVSLLLVLLVVGSAFAQKITTDYDHSASFSGYKTYAWAEGTPAKNPLMAQRIVEGIDKQLAAKGLQKVEPNDNPDLTVLYHAGVGHETELNTTSMGPGWGYRWGGGGMATTTVDKIPVGHLSVDIGDAKSKKLLWLGSASDTLSDNPEKNTKTVDKALDKMFKKFPPSPEKK
jgi:uncharacterized protein DUF4136